MVSLDPSRWKSFLQRHAGLWVLLLVFLPLRLWRASNEASFWLDEVDAVLRSQLPIGDMLDRTAVDAHPPLYTILLKGWCAALEHAGFAPGVLTARLLNIPCWIALLLLAWFGGRRVAGAFPAFVASLLVCCSPYLDTTFCNLRNYALALPATTVCGLVVLLAPADRPGWKYWLAYVAGGLVALWSHLLCGLFLAVAAVAWLHRCARLGRNCRRLLAEGLIAQVAVVVGFAPWLAVVRQQLGHQDWMPAPWMTPPTVSNLLNVFLCWFPLGGSVAAPDWARPGMLEVLGAGAVLVAFGMAAAGFRRRGADPHLRRSLGCLALAVGFVALSWTVNALGITKSFHGPRYMVFALPFWLLGLAGLVGPSARWATPAALPLLAVQLLGISVNLRVENTGQLAAGLVEVGARLPGRGGTLAAFPPSLVPYFRQALAPWHVASLEDVRENTGTITVLNLNRWPDLARPEDIVLRALLRGDRDVTSLSFPTSSSNYELFQLPAGRVPAFVSGVASAMAAARADHACHASALALRRTDGWGALSWSPSASFSRWGTQEDTIIRFDRPVPAGEYTLELEAMREPMPAPNQPVTLQFEGEADVAQGMAPPGSLRLRVPVTFQHPHAEPRLHLVHPTWTLAQREGPSGSRRPLTLAFQRARLLPR